MMKPKDWIEGGHQSIHHVASIGATCPIVYIIVDAFDRKIIARIEVVHEPGGRESIICGKVILAVYAVNRLAQRVGALGGVAGFVPAMLPEILLPYSQ